LQRLSGSGCVLGHREAVSIGSIELSAKMRGESTKKIGFSAEHQPMSST